MTQSKMIPQNHTKVSNSITIFHLGDEYSLDFVKTSEDGVVVSLSSKELRFSRELARLQDGRWSYLSQERFQEMWTIMNQHKKAHTMLKKVIGTNTQVSLNTQFKCGKRRFNVLVTRTISKLTKRHGKQPVL